VIVIQVKIKCINCSESSASSLGVDVINMLMEWLRHLDGHNTILESSLLGSFIVTGSVPYLALCEKWLICSYGINCLGYIILMI
jgi:hypothetical protein